MRDSERILMGFFTAWVLLVIWYFVRISRRPS